MNQSTQTSSPIRKGHLYFIGIVGHAMRGLALAARDLGYDVSGLDESATDPGAAWVTRQGIKWSRTYHSSQLDNVTAVIVSGGTRADYLPVLEAKHRGIAVESFAELVGRLTSGSYVIGVAGTHGKTTTTALLTWILDSAGRHPDYLVGIQPFNFPSSARLTGAATTVIEADEYRASALSDKSKVQYYHPNTLVLTSVEHDHPDIFPDLAATTRRFQDIVSSLPPDGLLIAWAESPIVTRIASSAPCSVATYGLKAGEYTARDIAYLSTGIEFDIIRADVSREKPESTILGRIAVPLFGRHNVQNTLAAVTAALARGLTIQEIITGAAGFRGAYRRFNLLTDADTDITVIDDYAHHPTEVFTTLEAARLHFPGRRLVAVFRPHTYSRTAALLDEYGKALSHADIAYVTDIESARETGHRYSVTGRDIIEKLAPGSLYSSYFNDRSQLLHKLKTQTRPGDVVVCMSVSGYDNLANELAEYVTHS